MKTYTEQEVVELLKKFDMKYTHNVNSDKWYFNFIKENADTENIDIEKILKSHE